MADEVLPLDPTANVSAMIAALVKSGDEMRSAEAAHVREILQLRTERTDDLREVGIRHAQELAELTRHYTELLTSAEAARIDAIRAVDVGAVNRAAEVAALQASTLATQVATSAETLRTQVQATATAGTVGLSAALEPIQKDIADLRRAQYEAQGQTKQVVETRSSGSQMLQVLGFLIAGVAVGVSILSALQ